MDVVHGEPWVGCCVSAVAAVELAALEPGDAHVGASGESATREDTKCALENLVQTAEHRRLPNGVDWRAAAAVVAVADVLMWRA